MGCLCSSPIKRVVGPTPKINTPILAFTGNYSSTETKALQHQTSSTVSNHEKKQERNLIISQDFRIQAKHEVGLFVPYTNNDALSHIIPFTLHRLYHTENFQTFETLREGDDYDLWALCKREHKAGNLSATNNYACLYLFGIGCRRNFDIATKYFHYASTKGNLMARNNIAVCAYIGFGDGTESSSKTLIETIQATTSYQRASWLRGDATNFDFPNRSNLYHTEWSKIYPLSPYLTLPLGGPLPKQDNYARKEFQVLANDFQCRIAMCNLGSCSSKIEALRFFECAKRKGCKQSLFYMGLIHENTNEIEMAGEEGNCLALGYLSKSMYADSNWHLSAMEAKCGDGLCAFARWDKLSAEKHQKEAIFAMFQEAAYQGCVQAQRELVTCYRDCYGVKDNNNESLLWQIQAAEHGCSESAYNLARFYEILITIEKDIHVITQVKLLALQWYQTAKQRNHPHADAAIQRLRCN